MTSSTSPTLNEQAAFYDQRWELEAKRPLSGIRLARAAAILHEMSQLNLANPKILDFGCGTGTFTGLLSFVGQPTGVELSPHAVKLATQRMPHIDFRAGDIFEVAIEESSFDVVILQEVIEHVEDQNALIQRCRQYLKPSGYLILTTPNKTMAHKSGVMAKAEQKGALQPIENLLTLSEAQKLVATSLRLVSSKTIIPVGHTGLPRLLNSPRLTRFPLWRAFRSCFALGLHTVVVAQRV